MIFYRYDIGWPDKTKTLKWKEVKLIVFMNHTSLYEFLFLGFLPVHFLWRLSRKMVAPAADKTLNRPIVGFFFRLFMPGVVSITRKRDDTWTKFLSKIHPDSIIVIAPEGRMKRKTGLDLEGNKMSVKSGITDLLAGLRHGEMVLAYSGGLHHVQVPGEGLPRLFKTLKMNLETFDIAAYKEKFIGVVGSEDWKQQITDDLQHRLETKVPAGN